MVTGPRSLPGFFEDRLYCAVSRCSLANCPLFTMTFQTSHDINSPGSDAEEVHGGGKGGLQPPGGASAAAAGDTKGSGGDSRMCAASSQGVVSMEGPGQTGKTPLCHHPQLWNETQSQTEDLNLT